MSRKHVNMLGNHMYTNVHSQTGKQSNMLTDHLETDKYVSWVITGILHFEVTYRPIKTYSTVVTPLFKFKFR